MFHTKDLDLIVRMEKMSDVTGENKGWQGGRSFEGGVVSSRKAPLGYDQGYKWEPVEVVSILFHHFHTNAHVMPLWDPEQREVWSFPH